MSEELKSCPFCGGADIAISVDENQGNKWGSAVCLSCSAVGPEVRTGYETHPEASWRAEAAAEWNRRASPTPEAIRRDALEEAAKVADDVQESEREEKRFDKEGGDYDPYSYGAGFSDGSITTSVNIGTAIRALSPPVKDTP